MVNGYLNLDQQFYLQQLLSMPDHGEQKQMRVTWARKFRSGDANPGVDISLNPALIAVPTDLTQGDGEFPALKIIRINLATSCGEPLRIGSRVPTVSVYAAPPTKEAGHWSDFYPTPAEYATGDQRVLQRLLASFPEEQYKFVARALRVIEQPYCDRRRPTNEASRTNDSRVRSTPIID